MALDGIVLKESLWHAKFFFAVLLRAVISDAKDDCEQVGAGNIQVTDDEVDLQLHRPRNSEQPKHRLLDREERGSEECAHDGMQDLGRERPG